MMSWSAACFITALVAGAAGYPGLARDMTFNGTLLAVVASILAISSFLVERGRKA
jgi:uncharacterized membrane protein YtjA (UPF0391 family)